MAETASGVGSATRPESSNLDPGRDTFPKLVVANAERLGDKVAIREKDYGIWQSYTWREYLAEARLIALGLASLGFAVAGDNWFGRLVSHRNQSSCLVGLLQGTRHHDGDRLPLVLNLVALHRQEGLSQRR